MTLTGEEKDMDAETLATAEDPHRKDTGTARQSRARDGDFETVGNVRVAGPRMSCSDVNVYYGDKHAIKDCSLDIGLGFKSQHKRIYSLP